MLYTPLHRALGERPGPLTDQMIDDAVAQRIAEGDELDWKEKLPPEKDFRNSGTVTDIAAFANAGGGMLVFGVTDGANGRHDAGELTESYERTIRQVSLAAIAPPVFGVQAIAIPTTTATRAVALLIPASPDAPHLVYRNEQFRAPLRTGADTHWMRERELEAAYRSRFDGAQRGAEALQQIYHDMTEGAGASERAVFVGAARPRTRSARRVERQAVPTILERATLLTRWWLPGVETYNPLEDLEPYRLRPTLGGQYVPPTNPGDYREAHAIVFDDGSLGLTWRAGGHERDKSGKHHESHQVPTTAIETFTAALLALVHAVANKSPAGDYDLILGVELNNDAVPPVEFHESNAAPPFGVHRSLNGRFRPVRATVDPSMDDRRFVRDAIDLATSALNQVGITKPTALDTMLPPRPAWDR